MRGIFGSYNMTFLEKLKKRVKNKVQKKKGKKPKRKKLLKQKRESEIKNEKWFEPEGELVVDVFQTDKEIVIVAPIAGVKAEDLDITVERDTIKIKGKREKVFEVQEKDYLIKECYFGPFSREIILPVEVDGKKAKASMKEGILIIKMPKIKQERKRKLKIKEE